MQVVVQGGWSGTDQVGAAAVHMQVVVQGGWSSTDQVSGAAVHMQVVVRRCRGRELYVVLEKAAETLMEVQDLMQRFSEK
jgi:hypothetical protein